MIRRRLLPLKELKTDTLHVAAWVTFRRIAAFESITHEIHKTSPLKNKCWARSKKRSLFIYNAVMDWGLEDHRRVEKNQRMIAQNSTNSAYLDLSCRVLQKSISTIFADMQFFYENNQSLCLQGTIKVMRRKLA